MKRAILAASLIVAVTACTPTKAPVGPPTISTATSTQVAICRVINGQADRHCTPGALNPDVTQATIGTTICVKGWTATVRPSTSYTDTLKRRQMVQYGETGSLAEFEEDHLVNLGIGGSPRDPLNLWPQPRAGLHDAAEKDREEVGLQRKVCSGAITLAAAQAKMIADWTQP